MRRSLGEITAQVTDRAAAFNVICGVMRYVTRRIVFPEGDSQEIEWGLSFGQLVDVSGRPIPLPVPTVRMLAYRVRGISTNQTRNEDIVSYTLEQLFPDELHQYTSEGT